MIKIEHRIPIPGISHEALKAMQVMQVGDSFFLNDVTTAQRSNLQRFKKDKSVAHKTFISRTENNGLRVWRTK